MVPAKKDMQNRDTPEDDKAGVDELDGGGLEVPGHPEEFGSAGTDLDLDTPVVTEGSPPISAPPELPYPVVGIGGSAGSLEALIAFFPQLSPETGMAFVILSHMAPQQQSHLVEILQRQTSMRVVTIEDGMRPEQNRVHVLPPNVSATLKQGAFHLQVRTEAGQFLPIDRFFCSLASAQKNFAIGIVLSGMDGDGAVGTRAIKGEGGFTMVQALDTAKYAAMPRSSIVNDHIDLVLPPEMLAKHLNSFAPRFRNPDWRRLEEGESSTAENRLFQRVLRLLRGVSGVDYRLYKPTTIRRRIARRMLMQKISSLEEYVTLLQADSTELRELQEDTLINVTQFFRDPEVFHTLRYSVIPQMFQNREPEQQVRLWVAGCSTGEEVYSLAMCLLEYLTGQPFEPSIQIFGTDASDENIQSARLGIYAESVSNEVSPERLRRFFVKTEKGYQVSKRVRDMCVFARQNLCIDPPFSRLDLVSCRNVLIYFGPQLQRQVISTFHYALRPNGFLLLGSSETIREFTDMFSTEDRAHKFFVRIGESHGRSLVHTLPPVQLRSRVAEIGTAQNLENRLDYDLANIVDRIVLARYGPPGVLVNQQMEILQSRGRTGPFIEMAQGTASFQLARMTRDTIAAEDCGRRAARHARRHADRDRSITGFRRR